MKSLILKILPPIWEVFFLLVALGAHFEAPAVRAFDISGSMWVTALGTIVFLFGFGMTLHSSKLFAEEKTEILPASPKNRVLITRGAYRFSRNPMYLGMVLSVLGVAFWIGTLPLFVAAAAHFCVLNFVFIPFEEEKMARQFGTSYEDYKKRVRRWF